MIARRSAIAPSLGQCSVISTPGARVAIGLNSPRIPSGALGFKSNVSIWLGAPVRKTRINDLARGDSAAGAASD